MDEERTPGKELEEKLSYKVKSAWMKIGSGELDKVFQYCEGYKAFLDAAKTEREAAEEIIKRAREKGFEPLSDYIAKGKILKPGTKLYLNNHGKSVVLFVVGEQPLERGINMIVSHIDSPRIDLKPNPLYEKSDLALFKTHYYGGIKKYQWVVIPLALHGVIVKANGEKLYIKIGEEAGDPVFNISDLLPHLAQDQMKKSMSDAITGESLNPLVGSIPFADKKAEEKVKLNVLKLLNEKYGIVEEDFTSAELELVPAFKAKDVGIDRSMIGGYGQDDRVCAYTSLTSILELDKPEYTCMAIFADKEEIGSVGNTGMESVFYENAVAELAGLCYANYSDLILRRILGNSRLLSADVNAGVDPNYEEAFEKKNCSYIGNGLVLTKYTGARGKVGSNDANAEFVGKVRKIFNDNNVAWQIGELGKVDLGGGGTVAMFVANHGIQTVDCGVALLSMHSPYEVSSKVDVYMAYKGYKAFYLNSK
ncbi:aminopeptidase [Caldanaerobius polysaccharolyticus]|uniref:aminopeptidase n=1 Tax=Caldanaerobius polysaccharolyticus TaxID=44256 RepID=UPI00047CD057|nr:aminopeptidase [Caldanaerobius polysaccharolyticus]